MISDRDEPETEHADLGHPSASWNCLASTNGLWFKSAGVMIAADHIPLLDE